MMRNRFSSLLVLFALAIPLPVFGQFANHQLDDLGLETAWLSQARVPFDGRGIASVDVWVDETATRKFAVVDLPGYPMVRVAADKLDAKNQPIGMEKAKVEAQSIAAKLLGKQTGFEVAEVNIPQTRLIVVTSNGLVQNFDAETGKLLWSTPCGPVGTSALPAALSSQGIFVVQGDTLYMLEWVTGKQIMTKHLSNNTSSGLSVLDAEIEPPPGVQKAVRQNTMALVADYSGTLTAYGISEKISPWSNRMIRRTTDRPVASPDRKYVAMATSSGMVYVYSGSTKPRVLYRFEAKSGVTGSLASSKDSFYIGSNDGVLAKVSLDGKLRWSFHLSHPIASPALIDEELGQVYFASESGEFTAVNDSTGFEAWERSYKGNVLGPIAIAGPNVICRTSADSLVALDRKTGKLQGTTSSRLMLRVSTLNNITDRVYLANPNGQIQCLRPIGKDLPRIAKPIAGAPEKPAKQQNTDVENAPMNEAGENTSSDPFGSTDTTDTPSADAAPGADPFGADPFAGGNP